MLQTANVGVGIRSSDTSVAHLYADFQISKFYFVLRLLLEHGRLSYYRTTQLFCFNVYKSFVLAFAEIVYIYFSRYSGT